MITRIRLVNFRRHLDTTLTFRPDEQLVLLAGANGVGKSTVFQAVLWALVGDTGRNRRADTLIRRGADADGAVVDVDLVVDGTTWTVTRRRERRGTAATLACDGTVVVTGPAAVTDAVCALLGVDAVGLRLAVYAAQGELDALASLRPADRAVAVARLLRVDELTRARDLARSEAKTSRDTLVGLGDPAELPAAQARVAELTGHVDATVAARQAAVDALAALDTEWDRGRAVDAAWAAQAAAAARAEGRLDAATAAHRAAQADAAAAAETLAALGDPVDDGVVAVLRDRQRDLEGRIARAEHARSVAEHAAACRAELARIDDRLTVVETVLADGDDTTTAAEVLTLDAAIATLERDLDDRRSDLAGLGHHHPVPDAGICPTCRQTVTDTFAAVLAADAADHERRRGDLTAAIGALVDTLARTRSQRAEVAARVDQLRAAAGERNELRRRRDVWAAQADAAAGGTGDTLDALYAERTVLAAQVTAAETAAASGVARAVAAERAAAAAARVTATAAEVAAASADVAGCAADADLAAAWEQRQELARRRDGERELVAALDVEHARLTATLDEARARLADAQTRDVRRRQLTDAAQAAADAAGVLDRAGGLLTARIRPALAGDVSALLTRLSDGRFTQVRIDDDYNLQVVDDGRWCDLGDCSGGERDLVALAVRLGLAEAVAGAGGVGWVLLDEIFGSQDPARRETVIDVLRTLRGRFAQILTISHVGGLDDTADRVVTLTLADGADGLPAVTATG